MILAGLLAFHDLPPSHPYVVGTVARYDKSSNGTTVAGTASELH